MKFKVRISELRYGEMDVFAASAEEARAIVAKNPGDVIWFEGETTDMTVEELPSDPSPKQDTEPSPYQRIAPNIIQMSGSLLESKAEVVAHMTNRSGVLKGKVANAIRQKYPEIVPNYQKVCRSYPWVTCQLLSTRDGRFVANLYGQGDRESGWKTDYAALEDAMYALSFQMAKKGLTSVAMPYGIGCGLAGGDWVPFCRF